MSATYLEKLNDRQREAVEHGVGLPEGALGGPLLSSPVPGLARPTLWRIGWRI